MIPNHRFKSASTYFFTVEPVKPFLLVDMIYTHMKIFLNVNESGQ